MKLKDTYTNNDFDNFLSTFKLNDKFQLFLEQYYQKQVISKYDWNKYIYEKYNIDSNKTNDLVYVYFNDLDLPLNKVFEIPDSWNWDSELKLSRNEIFKIMHRNDIDYDEKFEDLNDDDLYWELRNINDNVYSNDPCITSGEIKEIIDEYNKKMNISKDKIKNIKDNFGKISTNYDDEFIIINENNKVEFIKFENIKEVFKEFVNQNQSLLKEITNNFKIGQKYDFERVFDLSNKRTR